jgi:predicted metalloprotease with PDZ domain
MNLPARALGLALASGLLVAGTTLYAQAARKSMGVTLEGRGNRIFITQVDPGGPAEKAGLKVGDEIHSIAGITTDRLDPGVLRIIVDTARVMTFVIWRDDQRLTLRVQPGMYAPPPRRPQSAPLPGYRTTLRSTRTLRANQG